MGPPACTSIRRWSLAAVVACAGVLAALAGAASSPVDAAQATNARADQRPRTQYPVFILDRGRYTVFEAPEPAVQLFPYGINDRGQVAGEYVRAGSESGFVRDKRGRFTVFDIPGAEGTEALGINDRGQIVGDYSEDTPIVNDSLRVHGYLLDRGKVTRIDFPGAVGTGPNSINNRGQVGGTYVDAGGRLHGFLRKKGRFTTIDVPGAGATDVTGINDGGKVVGRYVDAGGAVHGFQWYRGRFTVIDAPWAPITAPSDVNNRGQIVGWTATDANLTGDRGFLLAKGVRGPYAAVDFPGAPRTRAYDINNRGQIVGLYENLNAASAQRNSANRATGALSRLLGAAKGG
jgi:uncharacterized membrane protein